MEMIARFSKWILLLTSILLRVYKALSPCIHTWIPFVFLIRLIHRLLFQQDIDTMPQRLITNNPIPTPTPPTLLQMLCSCWNQSKNTIRNASFFLSPSYVPFHHQTPSTTQYRSTEIPNMATTPLSVPKKNTVKAKFIIDIDKVLSGEEKRHTVMLRNIPNR